MTRRKRTLALLAAVLCLLTSVAQAAGSIDLTRKPTLTLTYRDGKTALSGAKFSIYRVADADETGELTVRSEFDEFDLDIRGKNDRRWREMAQTLESYVLRRELTPADSGKTDKTGMLTFPTQGKTLAAGLYLVIGERHTQGGNDYDAEPFFVLLPTQDLENNEWVYDVSANVKFSKTPVPDDGDTVTRKVLKVWDDDGAENSCPQEITVELLRNGKAERKKQLALHLVGSRRGCALVGHGENRLRLHGQHHARGHHLRCDQYEKAGPDRHAGYAGKALQSLKALEPREADASADGRGVVARGGAGAIWLGVSDSRRAG